jgi:hypothetical protein
MENPGEQKTADPRASAILMALTYVAGGVGVAIGFGTVSGDEPTLTVAVLLAVGLAGFLSFLRHSVFHRSDAVRMGWDLGRRNNFQIEVGIANLAFALLAGFAVVLDWGIVAEASAFLAFGFYLGGAAIMLITSPRDEQARPWGPVIGMAVFAAMLIVIGFMGMAA